MTESESRARCIPDSGDAGRLRDNIAYALLSVHASTRESDALLAAWRKAGRPRPAAAILRAWATVGAQFKPTKAKRLAMFCRVPDAEVCRIARDRRAMADRIVGLGLVKASFAAALNGSNVACLDRHLVRALRVKRLSALRAEGVPLYLIDKRLAPKTWRRYAALERVLLARYRAAFDRAATDVFVAQWTLWNRIRGSQETHSILWRKE